MIPWIALSFEPYSLLMEFFWERFDDFQASQEKCTTISARVNTIWSGIRIQRKRMEQKEVRWVFLRLETLTAGQGSTEESGACVTQANSCHPTLRCLQHLPVRSIFHGYLGFVLLTNRALYLPNSFLVRALSSWHGHSFCVCLRAALHCLSVAQGC